MANAIIRRIDELGRIVLPVNLRREQDIDTNDAVEVYSDGEKIIVRKHIKSCVFCGAEENIRDINGKSVCRMCISEICRKNSQED